MFLNTEMHSHALELIQIMTISFKKNKHYDIFKLLSLLDDPGPLFL